MSRFFNLLGYTLLGGDKVSRLIINERPLLIPPTLAAEIGLNEAIVLQQIHFLLSISDHSYDGRKWVYNSYDDWQRQFPFWSKPTIVRIIKRLEDAELIIAGNYNKRLYDRTKWYTINYEKLAILSD